MRSDGLSADGALVKAEPGDRFKPLPLEAQTFLSEGKVIDAIKSVRESHGLALKDAKHWIDAHIARNPLLRVQLEAQRREARRKAFTAFVVVDAIVFAGIIWYFFFRQ